MSQAVLDTLARAQTVFVASHLDPDADALGSTLGLMHLLEAQGKKVTVYSAGPIPEDLDFLPGRARITDTAPNPGAFDLGVLLDCHQPDRAGEAARNFMGDFKATAVIDHHEGEAAFGQAVWIAPDYAATAEMITTLAQKYNWQFTKDAALCLFAGLQGDTGSFCYSNTTARSLYTGGYLIEKGADPWLVSQEVYATRPNKIRLLALVMEKARTYVNGKLIIAGLTLSDIDGLGASPEDLEDVAEALRLIRGVSVSAFVKERRNGTVKASLRSRGAVNVAEVALDLGGGGHHNAAGLTLESTLDEALSILESRLAPLVKAA